MSDVAVRVENLGKLYRIGERQPYNTLRENLGNIVAVPFRAVTSVFNGNRSTDGIGSGVDDNYIWALKNVSFEVKPGEVVGFIGRNGAGKTTLLKILSRITEPTEGRAEVYGRVGSLLEVGTGFHPELTGRENIYLNGAILGIKKAEIDRLFDEIVDFSGVERFIDTPVKRYSSGMMVRLAFSVAAHLEPEVMLVDEVLAVGDAEFQKKCLGKMGDVAYGGRTVLFVSHNMAAVQSLCPRVIWIDEGRVVEDGPSVEVVSHYLQTASTAATEQMWDDITTAPGNDEVRIRRACVRPESGTYSESITIRTPLELEFEYWNLRPDAYLNLSMILYNEQGTMVLNTAPVHEPVWHGRPFPAGLFRSTCHVPADLLNDGIHRVGLLVVTDQANVIFHQEDILAFHVQDDVEARGDWHGKWPGVVRPDLNWATELVKED